MLCQLPLHADQSVTLTWNPSTAPNVAGYKIYYGVASQSYFTNVAVGNTTTATISGLVPGTTYYFAATTVDSAGDESAFSNEASYAVPQIVPTLTTLPTAGAITCGQTLASSRLSGGAASTAGSFAFTTPGFAPNVGTTSVSVTFTPVDTNEFTSTTASVIVTVNQALAAVTLGNLNQTYDGTAKPVSVVTSPAGLNVGVTYNASSSVPTSAGSYVVVATVNDPNYTGSATGTLVIGQATASVTLGNLSQTFDGTAKPVSVATSPASLNVGVTYNASSSVPTSAGSYVVVATVNDPNYTGSATGTLVIGQATASVTLGNLSQTFDGTAKPVTVTTSPASLNVGVTYNASSSVPTNAGSYLVLATVNDPNYTGSAINTLVIGQAAGSQSVTLTWNPSTATNIAGYKIYSGTASRNYSNVVIVGNTTNATISGLVPGTTYYFAATTFNSAGEESEFSNEASYVVPLLIPTITTLPTAGAITYGQTLASSSLSGGAASVAGSFAFTTPGLVPNAGTANLPVTFTPTDTTNYTTATTMVAVSVQPALAALTIGNLNQKHDGTAKPVSVATSPAGLNVIVTYNASSQVPTNAGSYLVVATVNDPNYTGSATNTLVIGQATASVTLGNLSQTFDGTAKPVSVATSPANLNVTVTYNASSEAPTNAGSYAVVAMVNDPNYAGSTTNILVINPAPAGLSLTNLVQTYDGTAKPVTADTTPTNLTGRSNLQRCHQRSRQCRQLSGGGHRRGSQLPGERDQHF